MRQLIYCPKCRLDGRDKVIAELLGAGTVAIARQRSKWSYEEATIVVGNNFTLICGYCRTPVYIQKEVLSNEGNYQRVAWIHRISFSGGSVVQETQSFEGSAGTAVLTQ